LAVLRSARPGRSAWSACRIRYGLAFKGFAPLDAGGPLSKAALDSGGVDVALIFTSDGVIAAKDFVVLEDDKHLQNADNVVPIIRSSVASDAVVSLLNGISSKADDPGSHRAQPVLATRSGGSRRPGPAVAFESRY
jgi:glycine betaine/choline ABC-type transport system substrate-binding protein